eukprot:EG_transcript_11033
MVPGRRRLTTHVPAPTPGDPEGWAREAHTRGDHRPALGTVVAESEDAKAGRPSWMTRELRRHGTAPLHFAVPDDAPPPPSAGPAAAELLWLKPASRRPKHLLSPLHLLPSSPLLPGTLPPLTTFSSPTLPSLPGSPSDWFEAAGPPSRALWRGRRPPRCPSEAESSDSSDGCISEAEAL